ncbi:MAG: ATP-dependent DNA helicase RecG, partial [Nitrospirae bacterium]
LFLLQTGLAALKRGRAAERGYPMKTENRLTERLRQKLPFQLTRAQERVIQEIFQDMEKPTPMNRLLQGDVGSGKTIVALFAMLKAVEAGFQAAIMAPTEILAEQHYLNIHNLIEELGLRCELLTGSRRDKPIEDIATGKVHIVVGTHALIQESVRFYKLGLVVVDEQHRFGVLQRAALRQKGDSPHVLVMTATPIPRTLSLTLYGDLDYSVIDELPPNRTPVVTKLFRASERKLMYSAVRTELKRGHQAYIVYPLIEESEKMDLLAATEEYERIKKVFPEFNVGLLHGKMKPQEKETIMRQFKEGRIHILVCTTVVEVGVDVPNATVMIIEHAERFGLSQLHQLRGRVGRGAARSYCFLVAHGRLTDEAYQRLKVMTRETDGFRIAEEDFKLRGPGELFGTRQSGMPDLKSADLMRDTKLLAYARKEAFNLIDTSPELSEYPALREKIEEFWKDRLEIFRTS